MADDNTNLDFIDQILGELAEVPRIFPPYSTVKEEAKEIYGSDVIATIKGGTIMGDVAHYHDENDPLYAVSETTADKRSRDVNEEDVEEKDGHCFVKFRESAESRSQRRIRDDNMDGLPQSDICQQS
eukprot:GILJ01033336.1.p1 GENE.GILJ01033336.1~~GILJ01033336.1.p1  ORF type:complete len:127 (-),score=26.35 GILJ01033336.1:504-884(-)